YNVTCISSIFFFNATPPTEIYTLSLHDALPIWGRGLAGQKKKHQRGGAKDNSDCQKIRPRQTQSIDRTKTTPESDSGRSSQTYPDRKSTRLNSSHVAISYAVFCLKKKKKKRKKT